MDKLLVNLSRVTSNVFHPIAIPSIAILILSIYSPSVLLPFQSYSIWIFLFFIFISTWLIPSLLIYGFQLLGIIKSIYMESKFERILAMLLTIIIYTTIVYFLDNKYQISLELLILFYCGIFTQLVSAAITFIWKISLHATAISSLATYIAILTIQENIEALFNPLLITILIAGITMSARLYLQKHNSSQVFVGCALGCIITIVVWAII